MTGLCVDCGRPALVVLADTDELSGLCGAHAVDVFNQAAEHGSMLVVTRTAAVLPH